jgi:hypothetical protein
MGIGRAQSRGVVLGSDAALSPAYHPDATVPEFAGMQLKGDRHQAWLPAHAWNQGSSNEDFQMPEGWGRSS